VWSLLKGGSLADGCALRQLPGRRLRDRDPMVFSPASVILNNSEPLSLISRFATSLANADLYVS
jgi:hypothetical protein